MKQRTQHRGESARNYERTNSRNSAPIDNLMSHVNTENVQVMYQFCKNYQCRHVEALILDGANIQSVPSQGILALAQRLNAPLVVIYHEHKDEGLKQSVRMEKWYNRERRANATTTWQEVAKYLYSLHQWHESRPLAMPKCQRGYDPVWLQAGTSRGNGNLDLSVSNVLRVIPGVRHIDIDASMMCTSCDQFLLIIEGSSDGLRGTSLENKEKATSMSRKIAHALNAQTLLVQHHVNDDSHSKDIALTLWKDQNDRHPHSRHGLAWEDAYTALSKIESQHICQA